MNPPGGHLKIAFVVGHLGVGGTQSQLWRLLRASDRARVTPVVISLRRTPEPRLLESSGRGINVQWLANGSTVGQFREFNRLVRDAQVDVVHSLGDLAGLFTSVSAWLLNLPHVHSVRSMEYGRSSFSKVARLIACRTADTVTVNCAALLEPTRRMGCRRLMITPNGIDTQDRVESGASALGWDGLEGSEPVILYIGRDHPSKDLPTLARTLSILARELLAGGGKVVFVGIGEGLRESVIGRIPPGDSIRMHFVSWTQDVRSWLDRCDVALLTSRAEGMPNVLLEAMASAKPVVCTDAGGCGEAVDSGVTGYLAPVGDAGQLAESILKVVGDRDLRQRMGRQAKARVERRFSMSQAWEAWLAAYDSARAARNPGT